MIDQTETTRRRPTLSIDIHAISAWLAELAQVALCPECELAVTAITADVVDLLAEVSRLYGSAIVACRQSANRLAAIRATLRAQADGETDPLGFLRDEIADSASGQLSGGNGGWCR